MGLRWTAAGMLMAQQGFRRVNGHITFPSWPTRSTGSTRRGRAPSPGEWPPAHRETRRPRSRTGSSRKRGGRRVQARRPQHHALSLPESAGSPIPGNRNPGIWHRKGTGKRLTPLEGIGYTRDEAASASRFQHRSGHSRGSWRESESTLLGANRLLYAQVGLLYQRGSSRGTVIPLHMGKSSRKRSALQGDGKLRAMASKVGAGVSEE